MTPAEIIYQRRIAVLDHAQRTGNVAEACRVFGISRTRYYEWKSVADRYGLDALMPKERRAPQMPEATPTHVVEALLTLAVTQPTIGCRQYADRLGDQGFSIAKSTVQKHLVAHGLGRRAQRLARTAAITAATTGLVTEAARKDEPFGFCLATGARASSSASTASTSASSRAWARCTSSPPSTSSPAGPSSPSCSARSPTPTPCASSTRCCGPIGVTGSRSGPSSATTAPSTLPRDFRAHLVAKGLRHERIPARSPNHNAVCERFHGTILQECWRPAFHRRHFSSIRQLQAEADAWLITYHHRRRNHGDYMRGRTPHQILDNHKRNKAA